MIVFASIVGFWDGVAAGAGGRFGGGVGDWVGLPFGMAAEVLPTATGVACMEGAVRGGTDIVFTDTKAG